MKKLTGKLKETVYKSCVLSIMQVQRNQIFYLNLIDTVKIK